MHTQFYIRYTDTNLNDKLGHLKWTFQIYEKSTHLLILKSLDSHYATYNNPPVFFNI